MSEPECISSHALPIPNIHAKRIVSTVANTTRANVPPQKSSSSTAPLARNSMARCERIKQVIEKMPTAFFFEILNSSSRKAIAGCASDIDDVIPARKRSINHMNANSIPAGNVFNISGIVTNPRSNAPCPATCDIPAGPKNIKAAGITILPPIITSANSFVLTAVSPERSTSSSFVR